jgi:hypothetical protein
MGSDYPFPMGDPNPVSTVRMADLGDGSTKATLAENAANALGRNGRLGEVSR